MTRRTRLRLTLLAVLAMFGQQLALASYVCLLPDLPMGNTAMHMHCRGMAMARRALNADQPSGLCAYHCAHQPVSPQDAQLPNVPPSLFATMVPELPPMLAVPQVRATHERAALRRIPPPPPPLRYRVLLI